jgi:hypothetical protein
MGMTQSSGSGEAGFDWSWTAEQTDWVPPGIDPTKPSVARIYDYYLGGKNNYAVDRVAAERAIELLPDVKLQAVMNRHFLHQVVERMAKAGIRQFIDLGTGMPTSPNVHEIARRIQPGAAVVYVDHDAVAATHARALLATETGVTFRQEDMRMPERVHGSRAVQDVIDFTQPIGLLCISVLHFVNVELAPRVLGQYRNVMVPGSQIAISAVCRDGSTPGLVEELEAVYAKSPTPVIFRSKAQIAGLFDGFELQHPGVVTIEDFINEPELLNDAPPNHRKVGGMCGVGLRA